MEKKKENWNEGFCQYQSVTCLLRCTGPEIHQRGECLEERRYQSKKERKFPEKKTPRKKNRKKRIGIGLVLLVFAKEKNGASWKYEFGELKEMAVKREVKDTEDADLKKKGLKERTTPQDLEGGVHPHL